MRETKVSRLETRDFFDFYLVYSPNCPKGLLELLTYPLQNC